MEEEYINELASVRSAIKRLTADPTATTSVSSANGGSYSASAVDLSKLHTRERWLLRMLAELVNDGGIQLRYPIYCGG